MKRAKHRGREIDLALELRWSALLGQEDLLREEIKRGKESLEHIRANWLRAACNWMSGRPMNDGVAGIACHP